MAKIKLIFIVFATLLSLTGFSQVVTETIQVDTTTLQYKVIYKPTLTKQIFSKKIAVFANDTSVVAISKNYTYNYLNGIYRVFYPSGRLRIFANYANNKLNGEWTWYNENGIIITKGVYKNDIKNGYWAYKSIKTYGRYKHGLKKGWWKRIDENEKKHKSYYKKGVLQTGEGTKGDRLIPKILKKEPVNNKKEKVKIVNPAINNEYQQAISFLTENVIFRKKIKAYYGNSFKEIQQIKKLFKNDKFQFNVSPIILALDISYFIKETKSNRILVDKINFILKKKEKILEKEFNGQQIKKDTLINTYSTNKSSPMIIYFSQLSNNLMRIDVLKKNKPLKDNNFEERLKTINANQLFSLLLYFDNNTILKGVEYQKKLP